MKIRSFYGGRKRRSLELIVVTGMVIILSSFCFANIRIAIPPGNYAPIYTDWYGNDEWVAFIFYREPGGIPGDFNLLNVYNLAALEDPLTVKGVVVYGNPEDLSPFQADLRGLGAVPIWFISREDYTCAIQDDVLTMDDLVSLPSLIMGFAHSYKETLHPEGHSAGPLKNIEAYGFTIEGRFFSLKITWVGTHSNPIVNLVKIKFRW